MAARAAPGSRDDGSVGVIYGNVGTTEFRFAVHDPQLKRLDYVKVRHATEGVMVLVQVMEVTRESGLSFDQAAQIHEGHAQEATDRLTAHARVIGYRDQRGLLLAPRTPFNAGEVVERADHPLIAAAFGLRDDDGAYVGLVRGYDIPVHLDLNTLVQKHVSVLAKTGSGKSYVVGCLMEELIKRGVPVVVIDPHGEHGSLGRPNLQESDYPLMRRFGVRPKGYAERIIEYSPDTTVNADAVPLTLDGVGLTASELQDALGTKLTSSQTGILQAAVRELAEEDESYTLADILERVKLSQSNTKWSLVQALENLVGLGIFADQGTPITSFVKRDKVSIINLRGVAPDVQQVVVGALSKKLFEARKQGTVPPFMLVVEEAHNFCPERGQQKAASAQEFRTIASEGRKFGLGLTVVSQRPAKVDKNVLSQCNTQMILKVTNPNDVRAITASVEGINDAIEDEIQRLPVGVAVVSHPRIAMPLLTEIRPRETSHGGESVDVMKSVAESETFLAPAKPARVESEGSGDDGTPSATQESEASPEASEKTEDASDAGFGKAEAASAEDAPATVVPVKARGASPAQVADLFDADGVIRDVKPPAEAPASPPPPAPPAPPAKRKSRAPAATPPPREDAAPDSTAWDPGRLPEWVPAFRDEFEAVEGQDLHAWDEDAILRVAADLRARADALRQLPVDRQEGLGDLPQRVDRKRAEAEELADRVQRKRGSLVRRWLGRRKRAPAQRPDAAEPAAPEARPEPAQKRTKKAGKRKR